MGDLLAAMLRKGLVLLHNGASFYVAGFDLKRSSYSLHDNLQNCFLQRTKFYIYASGGLTHSAQLNSVRHYFTTVKEMPLKPRSDWLT